MKRNRNLIVTTTSNIEGLEIQEYLSPISSHVVASTNLFSDMFAGISDFFGGRSKTYQRQISSIHEEAISLLKEKASSLGANSIVGLRIDHDEISGKSKSMFMVTATGTATIVNLNSEKRKNYEKKQDYLDSSELKSLLRKKKIINDAEKDRLELNEDNWSFIIENEIIEISQFILKSLNRIFSETHIYAQDQIYFDKSKEYFLSLPEDKSKEILYSVIINENHTEDYYHIFPFVSEVLIEGKLIDLGKIDELLSLKNFERQKYALVLLKYDKEFYNPNDIISLKNLSNKLKSVFPKRGRLIEEGSKFTSKIKKKWQCECGGKNEIDQKYCIKCQRDIYGFKYSEIHPKDINNILNNKIAILKEQFDS